MTTQEKPFVAVSLVNLNNEFASLEQREALALGRKRLAVTWNLEPIGFLVPHWDIEQDSVDYKWRIEHRNFQDLLNRDPSLLFQNNPDIDCFVLDLAPVSDVAAWVHPRLAVHLPIPTSPVARHILKDAL